MSNSLHYSDAIQETGIAGLLAEWQRGFPEMGVLALVAEADRETAVPLLQNVCARMNVPLRGAVFPALLQDGCFHHHGFLLIRFDIMPFAALYGPLVSAHPSYGENLRRMTEDVVGRIDRVREYALFMIFDAMVVNIATILDELYLKLADCVHYLGVNAGSETFSPVPCLFDNTRVTQDGALLMLLPDHPGAAVEHCYLAPERMISATSTSGNRIISIDWRPAFDVYREVIEAEYGVKIDGENFYRYAVHFPFGIVRANGEIVVRIPVALEKDGSLFCVGEVPPNALLTLLRAPKPDSFQTIESLDRNLRGISGDLSEILTFYCAGRRLHLGEGAGKELQELRGRIPGARFAGALSLGEIGQSMQWGYPLFHNGAILCCPWGAAMTLHELRSPGALKTEDRRNFDLHPRH